MEPAPEGPLLKKTAFTSVLSALTVYSPGCRACPVTYTWME